MDYYSYSVLSGGDWSTILEELRSTDHQIKHSALTTLNTTLLMSNEETLYGLRVAELCRILTTLLQNKSSTSPSTTSASATTSTNGYATQDADIQLLAVRALTNLCEALPGATEVIVSNSAAQPPAHHHHYTHSNAHGHRHAHPHISTSTASSSMSGQSTNLIEILCDKLLNITSMEVSEQSILAFQKISSYPSSACYYLIRAGALNALLCNLPFYPILSQRSAVDACNNIVSRSIARDQYDTAINGVQLIVQHMSGCTDEPLNSKFVTFISRVVQHIATAISMQPPNTLPNSDYLINTPTLLISSSSAPTPTPSTSTSSCRHMDRLHDVGTSKALLDGIKTALSDSSLYSSVAQTSMLTSLVSLARYSSQASSYLLENNIVELLCSYDNKYTDNHTVSMTSPTRNNPLRQSSGDTVAKVTLCNAMLPELHAIQHIALSKLQLNSNPSSSSSTPSATAFKTPSRSLKMAKRNKSSPSSGSANSSTTGSDSAISETQHNKVSWLLANKHTMDKTIQQMCPFFVQSMKDSNNPSLTVQCFDGLLRLVTIAADNCFQLYDEVRNDLCNIVASTLSSNNSNIQAQYLALQIIDTLLSASKRTDTHHMVEDNEGDGLKQAFANEGVIQLIQELAGNANSSANSTPASRSSKAPRRSSSISSDLNSSRKLSLSTPPTAASSFTSSFMSPSSAINLQYISTPSPAPPHSHLPISLSFVSSLASDILQRHFSGESVDSLLSNTTKKLNKIAKNLNKLMNGKSIATTNANSKKIKKSKKSARASLSTTADISGPFVDSAEVVDLASEVRDSLETLRDLITDGVKITTHQLKESSVTPALLKFLLQPNTNSGALPLTKRRQLFTSVFMNSSTSTDGQTHAAVPLVYKLIELLESQEQLPIWLLAKRQTAASHPGSSSNSSANPIDAQSDAAHPRDAKHLGQPMQFQLTREYDNMMQAEYQRRVAENQSASTTAYATSAFSSSSSSGRKSLLRKVETSISRALRGRGSDATPASATSSISTSASHTRSTSRARKGKLPSRAVDSPPSVSISMKSEPVTIAPYVPRFPIHHLVMDPLSTVSHVEKQLNDLVALSTLYDYEAKQGDDVEGRSNSTIKSKSKPSKTSIDVDYINPNQELRNQVAAAAKLAQPLAIKLRLRFSKNAHDAHKHPHVYSHPHPHHSSSSTTASQPSTPEKLTSPWLPSKMTLFEAINKYHPCGSYAYRGSLAEGGSSDQQPPTLPYRMEHIWHQMYELEFTIVATEAVAESEDETNQVRHDSQHIKGDEVESGEDVAELIDDVMVKSDIPQHGLQTAQIVLLLHTLHRMSQQPHANEICNGDAADGKLISLSTCESTIMPPHIFVSKKVSSKFQRQLEDCYAICGAGLPQWIHTFPHNFPFLFPLYVRQLYFQLTAFTPAQSLYLLDLHLTQQQGGNDGTSATSNNTVSSMQAVDALRRTYMQQMRRANAPAHTHSHEHEHDHEYDEYSDDEDEDSDDYVDEEAMHHMDVVERNQWRSIDQHGLSGDHTHTVQYQDHDYIVSSEQQGGILTAADRIPVLKLKVDRKNVLSGLETVFNVGIAGGTLKSEFLNSSGIGEGPTREFFTLASHEFQRKKLYMWYDDTNHEQEREQEPRHHRNSSLYQHATSDLVNERRKSSTADADLNIDADTDDMDVNDGDTFTHRHARPQPQPTPSPTRGVKRRLSSKSLNGAANSSKKAADSTSPPRFNNHPQPHPTTHTDKADNVEASNEDVNSISASYAHSHIAPLPQASTVRIPSSTPSSRLSEFHVFGVLECTSCHTVEIANCSTHNRLLTTRDDNGHWSCGVVDAEGDGESEGKHHSHAKHHPSSKKKKGKGKTPSKKSQKKKNDTATASAAEASTNNTAAKEILCKISTADYNGICAFCIRGNDDNNAEDIDTGYNEKLPLRQVSEWRIPVEELDYLYRAWPSDLNVLSHNALLCAQCHTMNFPGAAVHTHTHTQSHSHSTHQQSSLSQNCHGQIVSYGDNKLLKERVYRDGTFHLTWKCDGQKLHTKPIILIRANVELMHNILPNSKTADQTHSITTSTLPSSTPAETHTNDGLHNEVDAADEEIVDQDLTNSTADGAAVALDMSSASASLAAAKSADANDGDALTSSTREENYVSAVHGLYPAMEPSSISTAVSSKKSAGNDTERHRDILSRYELLGRFMAQSIFDGRLLDIPLSVAFLKRMLHYAATTTNNIKQQNAPEDENVADLANDQYIIGLRSNAQWYIQPTLNDMLSIRPELASTLLKLQRIANHYQSIKSKLIGGYDMSSDSALTLNGCSVDDLGLTYTVPGFPSFELMPHGHDTNITLDNLNQWIRDVYEWHIDGGVKHQFQSLINGFNSIGNSSQLCVFYPNELDEVLCGSRLSDRKKWDFSESTLRSALKYRQGYTLESTSIKNLLSILSSLDAEEQRKFIRFTTGCPRLPPNELLSLSPPITVVKVPLSLNMLNNYTLAIQENSDSTTQAVKSSSPSKKGKPGANKKDSSSSMTSIEPDSNLPLPSCMTCNHYLKLPDYPNIHVMRSKLLQAISECQTGFALS